VAGRSAAGDNSMVDVTQTVKAPVLSVESDDAPIRLLTIHGAKGLEAELVLILDTDALPSRAATMSVLVDWPGEAVAPTSFVFLASESRPAPSVVDAFATELAARKREELNALYVAMTRAKQQLVLSSVAPHRDPGVTWWQRLQGLQDGLIQPCAAVTPVAALPDQIKTVRPELVEGFRQAQPERGLILETIELLVLPELGESSNTSVAGVKYASSAMNNVANDGQKSDAKTTTSSSTSLKSEESSPESRIGQAMHRLLQWLPDQAAVHHGFEHGFEAAEVKSVTLEFELTTAQAVQAAAMAQRIATGEGAWSWDPAVVDWQGNELELFAAGQLLRLDRLVRRADTGDWWVLDYKSESQPQRKPELVAQLQAYRAAVQASQADSTVKAAFLTATGQLIEVNE
ncbi:MAG: 3'-5' exonuclease, partial [Burkholderiaceae bacterium]